MGEIYHPKRVAVYAGSFDPVTNGHLWMIEQGSRMFDKLIVAVGYNHKKTAHFTVEERLQMINDSLDERRKEYQHSMFRQDLLDPAVVSVDSFVGKTQVLYAKSQKANYLLRGVRSASDYEYEKEMMHVNNDIRGGVQTVFLFPPRSVAGVRSSVVMDMCQYPEWLDECADRYVTKAVLKVLNERFGPK